AELLGPGAGLLLRGRARPARLALGGGLPADGPPDHESLRGLRTRSVAWPRGRAALGPAQAPGRSRHVPPRPVGAFCPCRRRRHALALRWKAWLPASPMPMASAWAMSPFRTSARLSS